jgi:hypothetical protein
MSWEIRQGGQRYLYIVRRERHKLKKTYVGKGPGAYLVAKEIEKQAEQRRAIYRAVREFETQLWQLDQSMRIVRDAARQAIQSAYYMAGYRPTHCYHWTKGPTMAKRKPRKSKKPSQTGKQPDSSAAEPAGTGEVDNQAKPQAPAPADKANQNPLCIADTLSAMKAGRTDLLSHLRWQLSNVPQLWRQVGDISRLTIEGWARQIAGEDVLLRESVVLCAMEERAELVSDNPTSMARVIADRVVITRLQRQYHELFAATCANSLLGSKLGEAVEKRMKTANYEFREATRHLAKIRELQSEIAPDGPVAATAALRDYDPDRSRKSA